MIALFCRHKWLLAWTVLSLLFFLDEDHLFIYLFILSEREVKNHPAFIANEEENTRVQSSTHYVTQKGKG